ncbi:hypothetical protein OG239_10930 [Streptomyces sp. NBC_00868]|uniref:hypothetical protein n=1 Tax=unclassified Streptomyces TaxID=2593676 RepID=UPI00324F01F8|nr:hypothetical protein OG239_10930 [Streptomyces sp. NBC_00868]
MPRKKDTTRTNSTAGTSRTTRTTRSTRTARTARNSGTDRRRRLRREVPGTIGLLADAGDFAAMRAYRSFVFDDHQDYLRHVDGLLRSLAAEGIHTTVVLFDPEEYAEYVAEHGLDPDTAEARTLFTAELAGTGAGLPHAGRPIDELVPLVVDEAVRQATWEYATALLAGVGSCADCGEDIGQASFERATAVLRRLMAGAGPGRHHLVCSVPTETEQLVAVLHAETGTDPGVPPRMEGRDGLDFVTVLAAGLALGGPGGLVLRSTTEDHGDRVHGWRLDRGRLAVLSAAAVFNAYCTDADTGEPVAPEPGVEYCPGYEVDGPGPHH